MTARPIPAPCMQPGPLRRQPRLSIVWTLMLALAFVAGNPPRAADAPAIALAAANQAAQSGRYAEAIRAYNSLLQERGFSANVLYDLGNAWLLAGKPGEAILAYERAAWLAPRDPAIRTNLAAARARARIMPPARSAWEEDARAVSLDAVAVAGLVGLSLLCAGIYLRRAPRRLGPRVLLAGALLLGGAVAAGVLRWSDLHRAIILRDVPGRIAPAPAAASSFELRAGESVVAEETFGGYVRIHGSGGDGWVEAAALQPILIGSAPAAAPTSQAP